MDEHLQDQLPHSDLEVGENVLTVRGLSKSFQGNPALRDFSLDIAAGEISSLVGANGSGKSTLIKTLAGFHIPDSGAATVAGHPLEFGSPVASHRQGCRFVHQDLALIDNCSISDNVHLGGGFPTRRGGLQIQGRRAIESTSRLLASLGLVDVDPRSKVGVLSPAEKTGVALARAIHGDPRNPARLLVLDEPTATLPAEEVSRLLAILRSVAAQGLAVLYVTHHLNEVFDIGRSVTVLRDGATVVQGALRDLDRRRLIELLGGEEPESDQTRVSRSGLASPIVLSTSQLSSLRFFDLDIEVRSGEIVGVAGVTGSGRESVLAAIFGAERRSGHVEVNGASIPGHRPRASIRTGMAYLPPDRRNGAGFMDLRATDNLTLGRLRPFWGRFGLSYRKQAAEAKHWFEALGIEPGDAQNRTLERFSGGNQQKILLAKWLRLSPAVLLLDEPTQGVDIATKTHVHARIKDAASEGAAVMVSSTDVNELVDLCDRVIVLRQGRIFEELSGEDVSEARVTRAFMSEAEGVA